MHSFSPTLSWMASIPLDPSRRRRSGRPRARWITSRLPSLLAEPRRHLDGYWAYPLVGKIEEFWEDLSNWYVRLGRRRFWKSQADKDKVAAYATLYEALTTLTRLMAPIVPFLAEEMYQSLVARADANAPDSVFLAEGPGSGPALIDAELERGVG